MIKRIFDLFLSLSVLIIALPIMLLVSILIVCFLGGPVLFSQQRPGLDGKPFNMLKFRSMSNAKDSQGNLLPDEQRLTSFGRFLRSTSLDELPGLWSIVKGDMSLVGPRPLLMEYLPLYSPEQSRRHTVKPGLTGWAQVNGRNNLSWQKKFELDVWYVDNRSFVLDIKIILMTVKKVLFRSDINAEGEATMSKFTGNN